MTKDEMVYFCRCVLNDPYFTKFIYDYDEIIRLGTPCDLDGPNYFFQINKDYSCNTFEKLENNNFKYYGNADTIMEKLSLEDAKKYLIELSKHGIRRYDEVYKEIWKMSKDERTQFINWALHDPYLSTFIDNSIKLDLRNADGDLYDTYSGKDKNSSVISFSSPIKYGCSSVFLEIFKFGGSTCSCTTYDKADDCEDCFFWEREFGDGSEDKILKLSLEEAKKYVIELSKHGIKRYNEIKKFNLIEKINEL